MACTCRTWRRALQDYGTEALWRVAFTNRFPALLAQWEPHLPPGLSYRNLYRSVITSRGLLHLRSLGGVSQVACARALRPVCGTRAPRPLTTTHRALLRRRLL